MTAPQERLQVKGTGGKGQCCNIRKTNRQEWFYKALTNSIYSPKLKTCACDSCWEWKFILLLRMKSVWWVVRIFSVSTAFTEQRNTDVHFPTAALRPSHQRAGRHREGLTQGLILPITENPGLVHALLNSQFQKLQHLFSLAINIFRGHCHSLKDLPSVCHQKASHLCISALIFTGNEVVLKKYIEYEAFKKCPGGFITECQCVATPKWTFTWETPENSRPHTVSYRQPFCTSLNLP